MLDKKLTDKEITIKALKEILEIMLVMGDLQKASTISKSIDLINRLQAENENLKDILYDAEGVNLVNYWHQQCKIAENGCRNFEEDNKKLQAENEVLKKDNEQCLEDYIIKSNAIHKKALKTAKAEAYKKVFEKLNNKAIRSKAKVKGCSFLYVSVVTLHDINGIRKELVGE